MAIRFLLARKSLRFKILGQNVDLVLVAEHFFLLLFKHLLHLLQNLNVLTVAAIVLGTGEPLCALSKRQSFLRGLYLKHNVLLLLACRHSNNLQILLILDL